jgi:starch synthase
MFDELTPQSVFDTVGWAVYAWYNKKDHILAMQKRAMAQDFSWEASAEGYLEVYKRALRKL